jgi:hypothetical protein
MDPVTNTGPAAAPAQSAPQPSFRERKAAQLAAERGGQPPAPARDLEEETPRARQPESEAVARDDSQVRYASEESDQDLEGSLEDLGEEAPLSEEQELEADSTDWEKRYKDLQSTAQELLENRRGMEEEHAQVMSEHLQLRYQLEDTLGEMTNRAKFLYNAMTGNAAQFKNIDWSRVPPDKVQQVQAQAQNAMLLEQQSLAAYQEAMAMDKQTRETVKKREAEIAKVRLRRSIPGWGNEVYGQLRQFAASRGMPPQTFNEITDPVLIEGMHAYMQLSMSGSSVQKRTTRKGETPRGKAASRQNRSPEGRFATMQVEPNTRGSFAEKHKHRLAAERRNGR